jgi:uncharacterized protein
MLFEIKGTRLEDGDVKYFHYDNMTNVLKDADGNIFEYPEEQREKHSLKPYKSFDKNRPLKKSKLISHLKIQMGLSCNYSCDYCSQKFVERQPETSKKDIDSFLDKLEALHFDEDVGLIVEFWGGEPLVYWKTLKPLAEAIAEKFDSWKTKPRFSIITNGSILTDEIIDWLMMMDFSVAISHDGPGQFVRGPDPFDDPEQKDRILGFHRMMTRLGKSLSFNSMLNSKNQSRKEIYDWFVNLTGDENVILGEGSMVDAYDEEGISNSLLTKQEHFEFRKRAFGELYGSNGKIGFRSQLGKIDNFISDVLNHRESKYLGQKCGMDDEHTISVDLRGNVMTCQNVSTLEISKNGESHNGGNLDDYSNVSSYRDNIYYKDLSHEFSSNILSKTKYTVSFFEDDSVEAVRLKIAKTIDSHPDRLFILAGLKLPGDYYTEDPRHWEKLFERLSYNGKPIEQEMFNEFQAHYRTPHLAIPF